MGPERTDEILQKQDERDRVEEFKREVGPERVEEILQKQDERDRVTSCARGRGPPRTMPTPDDDSTAAALVSPVCAVEGVYRVTRSECGGWVRTMTPASSVTCMCRSELLMCALVRL
jgi:hypothetical protein